MRPQLICGKRPADLIVLSYSDSDLGAFAAAFHRGGGAKKMPSLRLANIISLKHPLSIDTYIEQTLSEAQGVLIRLIGGVPLLVIRATASSICLAGLRA